VWILHFLPDGLLEFIINGILVVGLISTVLTLFVINKLLLWFPAIAGYYRLLQAASVAVFLTGVYLKGGHSTEMRWREEVAEMQKKVDEAQAQAVVTNKKIVEDTGVKVKYIKGRTEYITQYIDKEIVKYDTKFLPGGECEIPREFIKAHNDAAEAPKK
jgi:hypothetical protein